MEMRPSGERRDSKSDSSLSSVTGAAEDMAGLERGRGGKERERVARWWHARDASGESWKGKFMKVVLVAMFIVQELLLVADSRRSDEDY